MVALFADLFSSGRGGCAVKGMKLEVDLAEPGPQGCPQGPPPLPQLLDVQSHPGSAARDSPGLTPHNFNAKPQAFGEI